MPESSIPVSGLNDIIFIAFIIVLVTYVGINFADLEVKMVQTFDHIEAKHIAHLVESCLKEGKEYIESTKVYIVDLEKCRLDADYIEVKDAINPKIAGSAGKNWKGNRNHRIAINIKDGDEIHPGWLYVEF